MKIISTPDAPQPAGHYSQAVVYGGVVYVAGMLGIDPKNPEADPGDVGQQTRQALANVEERLAALPSAKLGELLEDRTPGLDRARLPEPRLVESLERVRHRWA